MSTQVVYLFKFSIGAFWLAQYCFGAFSLLKAPYKG
jgi:hypothetical protein